MVLSGTSAPSTSSRSLATSFTKTPDIEVDQSSAPKTPPHSPLFSSSPLSVSVQAQSSSPDISSSHFDDRGRSFSPRALSRSVTPPYAALSQSLPIPVFSKSLSPHHPSLARSRSETPSRRSQSHRHWRNRKRLRGASDSEDSESDNSSVELPRRRPHWRYDSPSEHHAHSLSSFLRSRNHRAEISSLDSRVDVLTDLRASNKEASPMDSESNCTSAIFSSLHAAAPRSSAQPSSLPSPVSSSSAKMPVCATGNTSSTITDDVVAALGALASSPPPPPPPSSDLVSSSSSSSSPLSPGLHLARPFSWKRVVPPTSLPAPLAKRRDLHGASRARGAASLPTLVRAAEAFAAADPQHGHMRVCAAAAGPATSSPGSPRQLASLVCVPPPPPLVTPLSRVPPLSSTTRTDCGGVFDSWSTPPTRGYSSHSCGSVQNRTSTPTDGIALPATITPPPPPPPPVSALAPLPLPSLPLPLGSHSSSVTSTSQSYSYQSHYNHHHPSLFSRSELGGTRVHTPFARSVSHSPSHTRSALGRRSRYASNVDSSFSRPLPRALTLRMSDIPSAFSNVGTASSTSGVSSPAGALRPQTPPPTLANALAAQMQRHSALSRPGLSLELTPLPSSSLCRSSHNSSDHVPPPPPLSTMPLSAATGHSANSMSIAHPSAFIGGASPASSSALTSDALSVHQSSLSSNTSAANADAATASAADTVGGCGGGGGADSDTDSLDPANMSVSDMQDFMIECTDNGDLESLMNLAKAAGRPLPITRKTLHYCCRSRHPKIAKFILSQDCDPDARNAHGRTPLIDICANPLPFDYAQAPLRMISHLILAGANLEAQDSHNNTAVQWASSFFNTEATLQLLVSQGANIHHKSRHFQSAHEMAHLSGVKLSALKFGQYQFKVRVQKYRRALNNHCARYKTKELRNFPNDLTNLIVYGFIFGHESPKIKRALGAGGANVHRKERKSGASAHYRGTRSSARLRENSRRGSGRKRQRLM